MAGKLNLHFLKCTVLVSKCVRVSKTRFLFKNYDCDTLLSEQYEDEKEMLKDTLKCLSRMSIEGAVISSGRGKDEYYGEQVGFVFVELELKDNTKY